MTRRLKTFIRCASSTYKLGRILGCDRWSSLREAVLHAWPLSGEPHFQRQVLS